MKNILVNLFNILFEIICFGLIFGGVFSQNAYISILGMGAFFFIHGFIILVKKQILGLPFCIIGFGLLAFSISKLCFNGDFAELILKNESYLFCLIPIVIGVCIFWYTEGNVYFKKLRCTEEVHVKVIHTDYKEVYDDEFFKHTLAKNTYQYFFEGKEYIHQSEEYNNIDTDLKEFNTYINPDNPEEIIIPFNNNIKVSGIFISIMFVFFGLSIFIAKLVGLIHG